MILDVASQSLICARETVRLTRRMAVTLAVIADAYPGYAKSSDIVAAVWPGKSPNYHGYKDVVRLLRSRIWHIIEIETKPLSGSRLPQPVVVVRDWRNVGAIVPRDAVADLYAVLDLSQSKKRAQRLRAAIEVVA